MVFVAETQNKKKSKSAKRSKKVVLYTVLKSIYTAEEKQRLKYVMSGWVVNWGGVGSLFSKLRCRKKPAHPLKDKLFLVVLFVFHNRVVICIFFCCVFQNAR